MTHAELLLRDASRELKEKFGAEATAEIRKTLKFAAKSIQERDRQLRSTPRLVRGFFVYQGGKQLQPAVSQPLGLVG